MIPAVSFHFWSSLMAGMMLFITCKAERKTDFCAIDKQHIMCDTTFETRCPKQIKFFPAYYAQRLEILDYFNNIRNKIASGSSGSEDIIENVNLPILPQAANMPELEWNDDLEEAARYMANDCIFIEDFPCMASNINGIQVKHVYGSYFLKAKDNKMDKKHPDFTKILKNMMDLNQLPKRPLSLEIFNNPDEQYLWKNFLPYILSDKITKIGCAMSVYTLERIDYYDMPCVFGSVMDILHQPLFEEGTPCSKCPTGTRRSMKFKNLCKCDEQDQCMPDKVSAEDACKALGESSMNQGSTSDQPGGNGGNNGNGNDNQAGMTGNGNQAGTTGNGWNNGNPLVSLIVLNEDRNSGNNSSNDYVDGNGTSTKKRNVNFKQDIKVYVIENI